MLKAEQTAIINKANVHMVGLRGAEVLYFSQFFTQFGIQAALIAGFAIGNVTQIPKSPNRSFYWLEILWLTSVVTFALSMHVLISCILISVYGQGLALRGTTGSMVKAVEGMVIEQNWVVTYFSYTLFFLGLNIMGNCGIMMTAPLAICASCITFCGMFAWYRGSVRIYNRFKFTLASMMNDFSSDDSSDSDDINDTNNNNDDDDDELDTLSPRDISRNNSYYTLAQTEGYITILESNVKSSSISNSISNSMSNSISNSRSNSNHGMKWQRRYFVIKHGYGYYYTDRDAYQFKSQSAINKRRIRFTGYLIQENITDQYFALQLVPQEADDVETKKIWSFRLDTIEEFEKWKYAFTQVISISTSVSPQKVNFNSNNNNNNSDHNNSSNSSNHYNNDVLITDDSEHNSNKTATTATSTTSRAKRLIQSSVAKLRFVSKSDNRDHTNSNSNQDISSMSNHSKEI